LRALRHAEAVLCLYGTRGIATGFLAADDIGSLFSLSLLSCSHSSLSFSAEARWQRLSALIDTSRAAQHDAGVDARRNTRLRDTLAVMIHQIKTWIASAVVLIQDSLNAPADINGPGFDDGVAVLTRVLCERELRQSVWQRLLGMRPTADEAELLGLQQEFERLEDLLMALQQRLASVIDARMSVRQKWGRYDFLLFRYFLSFCLCISL
jgi:hypothetical protein